MMNHFILLFTFIFCFSVHSFGEDTPDTCKSATGTALANCMISEAARLAEVEKDALIFANLKAEMAKINLSLPNITASVELATLAACTAALGPAQTQMTVIQGEITGAEASQKTCVEAHSKADRLCILSSPQAQTGAAIMSQLSGMLPGFGSAQETCSATSKASFAGQGILLVGIAMCGKNKGLCDTACASSAKVFESVMAKLNTLKGTLISCASPGSALTQREVETATGLTQSKLTDSTKIIAKCAGYAAGLADLTSTAANLLKAGLESKSCADKLAASDTGGTATSVAQMCSLPANASSVVCKCRTDNTAQGCPGYLANLKPEGNLKALNTGGAANMAGLTAGTKTVPTGGIDIGDVSDEAEAILAATPEDSKTAGMFNSAAGASAGGGGSTGAAAANEKGGKAEEAKSLASSFMNAVGSMFKGGASGGGGRAADKKYMADQYKRQIAAEQFRAEVSTVNGLGNFEKIEKRYKSNRSTFMVDN